jgi:hypothetical protein
MKLSITPSEEYPRHELEIHDWLAKEKEILNRQKQEISILNESEKAYQIKFKNGVQEEHWIPKSQCKLIERK